MRARIFDLVSRQVLCTTSLSQLHVMKHNRAIIHTDHGSSRRRPALGIFAPPLIAPLPHERFSVTPDNLSTTTLPTLPDHLGFLLWTSLLS